MRISAATRFPHPVLSGLSADFSDGEFAVEMTVSEVPTTGALGIDYSISLTEPHVRALVEKGQAAVGLFVRCGDTYHSELRRLSWPSGKTEFPAGTLINRVTIRPFAWLEDQLPGWNPGTIHPEFGPSVSLAEADIVAIGEEVTISVGLAKLKPLETIFSLDKGPELPEGSIAVSPDGDQISIRVSPLLFDTLNLLRGQVRGRAAVMSGVYLPAVMEIIDLLREGAAQYESRRWYQPFVARCDSLGIDLGSGSLSSLEAAQKLLAHPLKTMKNIAESES